jgi:hydrogenase small subunit
MTGKKPGISRRDFIRIAGGASAVVSIPSILFQGCRALENARKRTSLVWLQAQSCSGCSVSLLNAGLPDVVSLLTADVSLDFHQTLSWATGDTAIAVIEKTLHRKTRDFILVLEGSVPTGSPWYCTLGEEGGRAKGMQQWVAELGSAARAVVAVGTCAAYGGIPAARWKNQGAGPTGARSLAKILPGRKVVCVPGCPPHPDWIVGTLVHCLLKGAPKLDEYNRPRLYFGRTVHDRCERLADYKKEKFAARWGDDGCLYKLGCLGMDSNCDIPARKWLGGANSCTGCGSGCIGCTEPVFPDMGRRGIYEHGAA